MRSYRCVLCFRSWLAPVHDVAPCPFCGAAAGARSLVRQATPSAVRRARGRGLPAAPFVGWLRRHVAEVGSVDLVAETLEVDPAWVRRLLHGKVESMSLNRIDTYLVRCEATYMLGLLYPLEEADTDAVTA